MTLILIRLLACALLLLWALRVDDDTRRRYHWHGGRKRQPATRHSQVPARIENR